MTTRLRLLAILTLIVGGITASSPLLGAENRAFSEKEIRKFVEKSMKANEITGLSAAVYDESGLRWAEGFGWADRQSKEKASPETLYRIGSITKVFTGLAIMQLVEEGKVDLDESLFHYLPHLEIKVPDSEKPPTVRSIMMHLSGLPSDHLNGMWGNGGTTQEEFFSSLRGEAMAAPVDYVRSYSNLGFSLLGQLIAEVSGESYENYVQNHLFSPMGMASSTVTSTHDPKISRGYLRGKEHPDPNLRDIAAGGVNSSVRDIAALAELVFREGRVGSHQIITPESWEEMISPQDTASPFVFGQEIPLVWMREPFEIKKAGPMIGHNGGTGLFFSLFLCLPQEKICAAGFFNSPGGATAQREIVRGLLLSALEEKTGWIPQEEEEPDVDRVKLTAKDLEALPGTYVTELGILRLERKGRKIKGSIDDTALEFIRMDDGHFRPKVRVMGFVRVTADEIALSFESIDGRDVLVQHRKGRSRLFGEKISPRPLDPSWISRTGTYRADNADPKSAISDLVLSRENGFLVARFSVHLLPGQDQAGEVEIILLPQSSREAKVAGLGRNRGDLLRFAASETGEKLLYSGFRMSRIP